MKAFPRRKFVLFAAVSLVFPAIAADIRVDLKNETVGRE